MTAPTYPLSSDVNASLHTFVSHYVNLRADALRLGAAEADVVKLGAFFSREIHGLRLAYLATNRLRVPYVSTNPATVMINGYMCQAAANVDLPGSLFSGGAARWYVFAVRAAGSSSFTLNVNTSVTESADTRLIGEVYWDGSNLDQGSALTYATPEVQDGIWSVSVGTDAEKSTSPRVGDMYIATDAAKMYACYVTGSWVSLGLTISTASAILGADVDMTNAYQWYDILSVSLVAGTWVLLSQTFSDYVGGGGGVQSMKLWDGTTVVASTKIPYGCGYPMIAIITIGTTTTYKVSGMNDNSGNRKVSAACSMGNNATQLRAFKIG